MGSILYIIYIIYHKSSACDLENAYLVSLGSHKRGKEVYAVVICK